MVDELLTALRGADVRLWLDGDKLRYSAPRGALDGPLRERLIAHRDAVVQRLRDDLRRPEPPTLRSMPRNGGLPLSYVQQQYWIVDRMDPGSAAYNIALALSLIGQLDRASLESALAALVDRHELLRTTCATVDEQPIQTIHATLAAPLECIDLRGRPAAVRAAEAEQIAAREQARPFDLATGPFLRATLVQLADREHRLILITHHFVADGWSIGVLLREFGELYSAVKASRPAELPPLPVQYVDFAIWQRAQVAGGFLDAQLDWWKRALANAPAGLELPSDRPRPAVASSRGATHRFVVGTELLASLTTLARRERVTLFVVLLAAFEVVLHRHGGQRDLLVATSVSNRRHRELEGLIGSFANNLGIRTDLSGDPTFTELLARVATAAFDAYARQDLPFVELLESLGIERDPSRPPLFQVMFVLHDAIADPWTLDDLRVTPVPVDKQTARLDLTLEMMPSADGLVGAAEYSTDLFDEPTIARMMRRLIVTLAQVVADPSLRISQIRLLTPAERRFLVEELNDTAAELGHDRCLHELFDAQARRTPEAIAVISDRARLSYRTLAGAAHALAAELRALGARPHALIGVVMERGWEQVVAVLAILQAGAAYLPLDAGLPPGRMQQLLSHAQVEIVVTQAWLDLQLPVTRVNVPHVAELPAIGPIPPLCRVQSPSDLAYVIYTSGSTGTPKGVMIDHRGAVNTILDLNDRFEVSPDDRVFALSSSSFDLSVYDIFGSLAAGAAIVMPRVADSRDPARWAEWIATERVTIWNSVPALMTMLIDHEHAVTRSGARIQSLRQIWLSGDWIPVTLPDRIRSLIPDVAIIAMGGATEASIWSIFHCIDRVDPSWRSVPYGRPLRNQTFFVLDDALEPCPIGVPGMLHIGGLGVARGYLHAPELTAAAFIEHPEFGRIYRTGDLGRHLVDGTIEFLGRKDFQVKLRGHRIELGEIEATLAQHDRVRAVAVEVRTDGSGAQRLVAYVVLDDPAPTPADLRSFLHDRLPDYMVPWTYVALDAMPLSQNGKIDRRALPDPRIEQEPRPTEPRSPAEALLLAIWQGVLEVQPIGIHDNFFELGGDSILCIRVVSRATAAGLALVPRQLFENPTIAGLAAVAGQAAPVVESALTRAPERRFEPFPLTDLQQAYVLGQQSSFELGGVVAVSYVELDCPTIDTARLAAALDVLIARHDMLRCVMLPDGTQQVLPSVDRDPLSIVDLSAEPASIVERRIDAVRASMTASGPATDRWPLFDLRVHLLAEQRCRLHLAVALLWCDGGSAELLFRELLVLYADPSVELPPIGVTFRDFVLALHALERGDAFSRARQYWLDRAASLPAAPELPLARSPRSLARQAMVRRTATLDSTTWRALRRRASAAGLTANSVLCAAYAEVLARWSKEPHFTLNLLIGDRPPLDPDIARVVGNFSTTLLLEIEPGTAGDSFTDRARRLQARLASDLEHRGFSGVRVLGEINRAQGQLGRAGMPIVFASTLGIGGESEDIDTLPTFEGEVIATALQTPQVWIDHNVFLRRGALVFNWDVAEPLFPAGLIDAMFAAYGQLLARLAGEDRAWHEPVEIPLAVEQAAARARVNSTDVEIPRCLLHAPFEAQARTRPDAPAVLACDRTLSYAELSHRANALAAQLVDLGAQPEQLVAVVLDKGWEQIVATLAISRSGAAYLPVDPSLPGERMWHLLEHGQVRLAVTRAAIDAGLEWPDHITRILVDPEPPGDSAKATIPAATPDNLAYVIYTSGSTGQPKGVMIEHHAAINTILDINRRFAVSPTDRTLALSSLGFDLSVWDIFGALAAGAAIVLPDPARLRDPAHWVERIATAKVTIWNAVPALLDMLVEHASAYPDLPLGSLRLAMASGDWIPVSLPDRLRARVPGVDMVSLGGATEASIWSIAHPIADVDPMWTSIPYGTPLANQRFDVIDRAGRPRPVWTPGELVIVGRGVARGYWRDPERTAERFDVDPQTGERRYHTGDLGRYWPDGTLEFLGREDLQVKVQGFRIELGEIEAALAQHSAVRAAVVLAIGEPRGSKRLVAFVVASGEPAPEPESLRVHLRAKLPDYMVPTNYVIVDRLVLTANGKVDRRALAQALQQSTAERRQQPAGDATEHGLVQIWEQVLDHRPIGVTDNFFELGGNSMIAVRLMVLIERRFGTRLPLASLLEGPTIEQLAAVVRDGVGEWAPLVPIRTEGDRRPLFLIHPVGGNVLCYVPLVRELSSQRPVYALQAPALGGAREPHATIEAMAGEYLQAIREVQPAGPYLLGGWSLGGVVALELASQLRALGEAVELVAMIDSGVPRAECESSDDELLARFERDLGRVPAESDRRLYRVFVANMHALHRYTPRPYAGRVALLRASRASAAGHDALDWATLGIAELAVETMAGDHYTLLAPASAAALARWLEAQIGDDRGAMA